MEASVDESTAATFGNCEGLDDCIRSTATKRIYSEGLLPLPKTLECMSEKLNSRPLDVGTSWDRMAWRSLLERCDFEDILNQIPNPLKRGQALALVAEWFDGLDLSKPFVKWKSRAVKNAVIRTFILIRIWGDNPDYQGPMENSEKLLREVLVQNLELQDYIVKSAYLLHREGVRTAWRALSTQGQLNVKGFGVSYVTKFFYFLSSVWSDHPALILGSHTSQWFIEKSLNDFGLQSLPSWRSETFHNGINEHGYIDYLSRIYLWADIMQIDAGELERLIYLDHLTGWGGCDDEDDSFAPAPPGGDWREKLINLRG